MCTANTLPFNMRDVEFPVEVPVAGLGLGDVLAELDDDGLADDDGETDGLTDAL